MTRKILYILLIFIIVCELAFLGVFAYKMVDLGIIHNPFKRDTSTLDLPTLSGTGCIDCNGKPIIYLYPTATSKVQIKLGRTKYLWYTYPKYDLSKGWNVTAYPNGDLEDLDSGRELYALYREGKSMIDTNFDEGFVVEGKGIIPFLEEKLEILGLNERETEEFIVYWLPQMEGNKWNLIRFESIEEQNENMPLMITPKPDTLIRVMMDWKPIDAPINVPEQNLITPIRSGFVVVEWGGTPRN